MEYLEPSARPREQDGSPTSSIRRYWQGELVRTHTWTRELTFTQPFRLGGFAQALPSGRYKVEFTEVEVAVRDRTVKQVMRCMVPIPPSLLPPGVQTMVQDVDHTELERRHVEDTRRTRRISGFAPAGYKKQPRDHPLEPTSTY